MRVKGFKAWLLCLTLVLLIGMSPMLSNAQQLKTPKEFLGFKPGADRMLMDYGTLIAYLKKVEAASPRVKLVEIGKSPMGKTMYIAFISAESNINKLEELRQLNKKLALDATLPHAEREALIKKGKVFFLGTLSMHSGEVAPSQSAALIAYEFATTKEPLKLQWLNDVVYMMVPCHNPDGMDMVVNHYKKYKGTKYEGCSMPGVYHKYVGHDNNRDFITLSQTDTKAIAGIYNLNWYPQVMVEKHQMGSRGPRYFVPPNHDPIAENIDAAIWNWCGIFGSNMIKDMTKAGLAGISQHYIFDNYWPGSTETSAWKNVISFLTEAASSNYAKPIYIEPNELAVYGKGLSEYKKSANMPLPWAGGWWRLGDIVEYEIQSTMSMLKTASLHREDILRFRNDLCKREVKRGKTEAPYHYILPLKQHDHSELVHLVNLLKEHGVEVYQLAGDTVVNNRNFKKGDIVVPLAQSFRPFIKEVMEAQQFPVRHYTPGGKIILPYDITSWSLPLHRGVTSFEINKKSHLPSGFDGLLQKIEGTYQIKTQMPNAFDTVLLSVKHNDSFKAAFKAMTGGLQVYRLKKAITLPQADFPVGSFVIKSKGNSGKLKQLLSNLAVVPAFPAVGTKLDSRQVNMPRIALIETIFHDMDAGWTRYVMDSYGIPFDVIRPDQIERTDFKKNFDVVLMPSSDKNILMDGKRKRNGHYYFANYPPKYAKGMGKKGLNRLLTFLDQGGIILSWERSTGLFMGAHKLTIPKQPVEEFRFPIRDIADSLKKAGLYCPGSLMKLDLKKDHPITYGMPDQIGIFFRGKPVFQTSIPVLDMDRRVIGKFPEKNILLSGYAEKEEKAGNKSALVWLKKNKGQLVIFGFNPQFRASTQVAFKLMFNSILLPKLK